MKPGPETHAVDVADPTDGQRPGWVAGFGLNGFSTRTGVRNSTWPARCVLFTEYTAQVTAGQSTFVGVGNPSDCEVCLWGAQGDVMAARVVGIRQEGVNPCRMVPSMRDEVHVQLHDVTGKVQSVRL